MSCNGMYGGLNNWAIRLGIFTGLAFGGGGGITRLTRSSAHAPHIPRQVM